MSISLARVFSVNRIICVTCQLRAWQDCAVPAVMAVTVEASAGSTQFPPHDLREVSSCRSTKRIGSWHLAGVPSAAQRFNQLNAGEQLLRLKGNVCLLVGQQI